MSNARELQRRGNVECVGGECPQQYFGSCFNNIDCKNSCFPNCKTQLCICKNCTYPQRSRH